MQSCVIGLLCLLRRGIKRNVPALDEQAITPQLSWIRAWTNWEGCVGTGQTKDRTPTPSYQLSSRPHIDYYKLTHKLRVAAHFSLNFQPIQKTKVQDTRGKAPTSSQYSTEERWKLLPFTSSCWTNFCATDLQRTWIYTTSILQSLQPTNGTVRSKLIPIKHLTHGLTT